MQDNPTRGRDYLDNYRPVSDNLSFIYPYSPEMNPPSSYLNASITQLFYTVNAYHDLLYHLGFNEAAGNFQTNNRGKGGKGNDYLIAFAQTGGGYNDASFGAAPDGELCRLSMYMANKSKIERDGVFDTGIVIHEYTHGGK